MISRSKKRQFKKQLQKFLPGFAILDSYEELIPYECDGLSAFRCLPLMVVLPEHIEQVQKIVKICREFAIPIVPRGAATGMSGGALPVANGIILSCAKLNRIINVDVISRTARVQAGVRNAVISQKVKKLGLHYTPDPRAQIASTIGGNVAQNVGGLHSLKHGFTIQNILEVTIVTIDGEIVTVGGSGLDSPGYDLLALLTGSEGLLGIIVEVVVKLVAKPEANNTLLAIFGGVNDASQFSNDLINAGIIPAALAIIDNFAIRIIEKTVAVNYPVEAGAIVLCDLEGLVWEVERQTEFVNMLMLTNGAIDVRIANQKNQCDLLWQSYKAVFTTIVTLAPDYFCVDGTIPIKDLTKVLRDISQLSVAANLNIANVINVSSGCLLTTILFDSNKPDEIVRVKQLAGKILDLCIIVGGSISGEQGIGVKKLDNMCHQFDNQSLSILQQIKAAFDEQELLNPGKVVPTLQYCSDLEAVFDFQAELPPSQLDVTKING